MWIIDQLEINGGFLPGLKLKLPAGLICIIGPRGSGKSTLAEGLRFAIRGTAGASKPRLDLLQANFGSSGLVTLVANTDAGGPYTIKRSYKQPAVLLSADGRTISNVDLDRGTFLPVDAYNGPEIEAIADETLGERRRGLLDDLRGEELSRIHLSLGEHRRGLEANADRIRATRRSINDLSERIEEFGDISGKLDSLGPLPETGPSTEYTKASKQQQCNSRERRRIDAVVDLLDSLKRDAEALQKRTTDPKSCGIVEEASANSALLQKRQMELQKSFDAISHQVQSLITGMESTKAVAETVQTEIGSVHSKQQAEFTKLQQLHQAPAMLVSSSIL